MKTYRAKFNPNTLGVYGISLVENPAMEGDFLAFDKQEVKLASVDEEKRLLLGLVLEPNKMVYRNQGGEEFNVFFTEQDIQDVAYNFQKKANQNNSTLHHSGDNVEGLSFVETWLVEDSKIDKSAKYGFNYPKGSWVAMMKVDNDDVWNDYVKTGKVKGFSIDAFVEFEEVNINNVDMSKQEDKELNLIEFLKELPKKVALHLKGEDKEEVKAEATETTDEVTEEEVKEEVEVVAETETTEEVQEEVQAEEVVLSEDKKMSLDEFVADFVKEFDAIINPLIESNVAMKSDVEKLTKVVEEQKEQIIELSKEPVKTTIKKVAQLDFSNMTELEKRKYFRNNG